MRFASIILKYIIYRVSIFQYVRGNAFMILILFIKIRLFSNV